MRRLYRPAGRFADTPTAMEAVPVTSMNGDQQSWQRNQYRTTARVQMDDRRLLLRGGPYDGRVWLGVVAIGDRVFCGGTAPWSMAGMYVVTAAVETHEGDEVNIAVPILATV